ncbi:hypothetical protein L210DRAFT_3445126 [Boletus edulis BED1]|uniref:Beach-domain-containing protein n=1 Tax=Boletus edulis BED1 TaxID=1328754 RepID=A0AAD4C0F5_BOLED|nr:hypothetical protein L210DRAFT_3445126 [Boletus edulis BED1]
MLRSLLAPLRNLQDHGHETGTSNDAQSGALAATTDGSALATQIKSLVEVLKLTEDTNLRITILQSLQSLTGEHSWTLDAFREADGFLVLIHVLSTLPAMPSALSTPHSTQQVLDCMQLSFMLTSKALNHHPIDLTFFEEYVGYTALSDACDALIKHPVTFEKTLGCLLSLSFHEVAVADLFVTLQASCHDLHELDIHFLDFAPSLGTIHLPRVFKIVWEIVLGYLTTNTSLRLIVYKILEHLTHSSHRNLAVLSMLGILTPMFSSFISLSTVDRHAAERRLQYRIIKRLFEMGASTQDAQRLLQCAVKEDKSLDTEMIDLIRVSLRSKWPPHISFQDMSAVTMPLGDWTTLPTSGLTFMLWVWFERMPSVAHKIFSISFGSRYAIEMSIGSDGVLALRTSSRPEFANLSKTRMETSRWTHITLVYYPHRASQPAVRVFVDGVLSETFDWTYPSVHGNCVGEITLGDKRQDTSSWCIVSAYLLSTPLDDELPRFIHHLGPKYQGNFQDRALVRFLTYEASTSLNMHMVGSGSVSGETSLKKAIRDGILINEASILCKIVTKDIADFPPLDVHPLHKKQGTGSMAISGPLVAIPCRPLDLAFGSIGGAQLVLCLVSLAETSHELSRTIAILCDSLRDCWQNSEDMERVSGYDVLASILYQKSRLINMTTFEILFEFLGLSFRSPDVSTVTNTVAYVAIALDFELWSMTTPDVQRAHLEHFAFLLRASRHRKFNAKVCLSKLNLVRRLLFAMQLSWYSPEIVFHLVNALGVVMQAQCSANDVIKPVASYIAANATSCMCNPLSLPLPWSSFTGGNEKARLVLDAVISFLRIPTMYMKFAEALPVARITLLWLGSEPSPAHVCQVLAVIGISFSASASFGKKFELASGWLTLKKVLPPIWNDAIHEAALDLLLQPARDGGSASRAIKCPQMLAVMLLAFRQGLLAYSDTQIQGLSRPVVERILGDLINLHSSHSSFRQLFKSQTSAEILIECLSSSPGNNDPRVSTRLTQLGLLVAMGNHVPPPQKQQILEITKPGSRPASHVITPSSSRLSSVQEEALQKSTARLEEWRNTIVNSERERFRKTFIDMRERRRHIAVISEGVLGGCSERDVWCHLGPERTWRLDETEGPHRTRNKLESFTDSPGLAHHTETDLNSTKDDERDPDVSSTLQVGSLIKEDAERSSDDNGAALEDEIAEDKHRRVRHELEPGDVIEAVSTICRVSGVDSYPGLLIFGRTHLYMLDGLIENDVGELIDAVDAPKGMFFVAGSTPHLRSPQRARRWSLEQIAGFSNKSFLFRDVALEIFFKDSRTLLAVFLDGARRHDVSQRLQTIIMRHSTQEHVSILGLVLREMSIAMPKGKGRASLIADDKALATAQRQWQNRKISNYTYLSILNQLSGRTPNDATQYPVFPWVLKDYTSDTLDLSSPDSFRDLSKPMGALTPERCGIARSRYENLESVGEKPFHYGTHFSSSMIVCHYLIRMAPYTSMFKTLQGGDWDLPDRLFIDIGRSYLSASQDMRGDVRELIPEFFTCPEFLENLSNIDFGCSTSTGEKIHNVKLPPWAKGDPLFFVHMHRQALESRYVSENLPAWIDLIWGCKQRDVDALNVFHPLSYEGAIDLDKITDPLEREATVGIIHNFGQTPRKLFSVPHPPRNLQGILSLPVRASRGVPEDALALTRDPRPLKVELSGPVACVVKDGSGRVIPMPEGLLSPPSRFDEQIQWGKDDNLRTLHHGTVIQTIEATSPSCAAFADQDTLVTGSDDSLVRIWRMSHTSPSSSPFVGSTTIKTRKGQEPSLTLVHLLRKHIAPVISLCVSRAWTVVISGSLDGSAIVWDLNRGLYVRSIWHADGDSSVEDAAVHLVAINESTGYISTCSTHSLWLHTINARPIARLDLTSNTPRGQVPCVTSITFHERDYSHLGILAIGRADGSIALYTWNAEDTPKGAKAQWGFLKVRDLEAEKNTSASITSLHFIGETLWVGESSGKVARWFLPD